MSANTYEDPAPGGTVQTTTEVVGAGPQIHRRVSWGAIFSGGVIAVIVQVLLSLLGAGIGLGAVDVNAGGTPDVGGFGIGASVWWVVSSCIALFIGGYVAARLAGVEARFDGVLHGLVVWGIVAMLTFYLLTSALGGIIGGGFSALRSVVHAAGSGVKEATQPLAQAAGVTPEMIQQQAQAYLQPPNPDLATMSPQDAQKEIARNLVIYAKGGPDAAAAKQQVIAIMAAQTHISQDEATKRFDDAQAKLKQARDQAVQTAKNAADASAAAASEASFAVFGDLLLGAIFAAIGGSIPVQRRVRVAQPSLRPPGAGVHRER